MIEHNKGDQHRTRYWTEDGIICVTAAQTPSLKQSRQLVLLQQSIRSVRVQVRHVQRNIGWRCMRMRACWVWGRGLLHCVVSLRETVRAVFRCSLERSSAEPPSAMSKCSGLPLFKCAVFRCSLERQLAALQIHPRFHHGRGCHRDCSDAALLLAHPAPLPRLRFAQER